MNGSSQLAFRIVSMTDQNAENLAGLIKDVGKKKTGENPDQLPATSYQLPATSYRPPPNASANLSYSSALL